MRLSIRGAVLAIAGALALVVLPTLADAKLGRSGGFGSRGSKTFQAPPSTRTAPGAASSIQRSAVPRTAAPRPGMTKPGMFGGMSRGGFMAGLLGAGLLGALFGYGLSGGLGGLGAMLGLLAQIALLAVAAMLLFSWFQRRNQPRQAMAHNTAAPAHGGPPRREDDGSRFNSMADAGGPGRGAPGGGGFGGGNVPTRPLQLADDDFSTFERLLTEVQDAYAREDMTALSKVATEEMCGYFAEDIEENKKQGQAIRISGVKLLQGDLSEAWKEPGGEYATVAMRFSIADAVVERASGKVIEGSLTEPQELTEVWTFVRRPSGSAQDWQVTAVQPIEEGEDGEA
ncbi:MAG: TIM44-like domain-containing protein [Beijerinckiaceae bacterium]